MDNNDSLSPRVLLLAALEEELGAEGARRLDRVCDVKFTGVGKLRAFEAAAEAMERGRYDVVINAGTCGSLRHAAGTVLRPSRVVQGDIYIDSMFATEPETLPAGDEGVSIISSDDFIGPHTTAERREVVARYDCFDMESYAVVRAVRWHAALHGREMPRMAMLKVVSDNADGTAEEWSVRIAGLRPTLVAAAEELIESMKVGLKR